MSLNNNRATVFVHYDRDNIVDDYVYFYLQELQKYSSFLVFVSTTKLKEQDIENLSQYCSRVIVRENIGYDFMSYKIGLESFVYQDYDEVVICNDSIYGPVYPLKNIFNTMQHKECDFWGITDNNDIDYHLQSYFLVFKKEILNNQVFSDFWDNVEALSDKNDIIKKYEVGLTRTLIKAKFTFTIYSSFKPTIIQKILTFSKKLIPHKIIKKIIALTQRKDDIKRIGKFNTTHYFWKELLISQKMPFVKIELLRDNPMNININDVKEVIQQVSDYDTTLIDNHLARIKNNK
ncbi:Alpha-L-Rha alpha-1,2-L-rhamnosyltransferase/alpha-L-Rha alpha-1,3-L-rhamnosyltransferase [hydrothermal vent metagenome]|uniref:Alpha-L-Rha alpha-1,2-L-rhamnosyltransferase/alpha-L-Rha alpha-1,3-L-rhamnosyltransferase n=1 Tax=hydrothermal vent metagenome TaxID=652676 RepID=A0A3B1E224_9ZZZZ